MVNKIFQVVNASIYFFAVNTLFILEEKSNWTHWKNIYPTWQKVPILVFLSFIQQFYTSEIFSCIFMKVWFFWFKGICLERNSLLIVCSQYHSSYEDVCDKCHGWKNHNISKECNSNDITLPQFLLSVYISSKYILWKELSISNFKVVAGEKGSNFHEESCELILTWYI